MPKYDVVINVSGLIGLEIDAKDKGEAEKQAWTEHISSFDIEDVEVQDIESVALAEGEKEEEEENPELTGEELEALGQN